MNRYLKCSCQHCGGHIEFPGDALGATVQETREKYPPLGTVTGDLNAASDHAAVRADFDL